MNNWTRAFLIALRIAIGWHFLYEGLWKVDSDREAASTSPSWYTLWNATATLRAAYEPTDVALDPAKADAWYDEVVRGLRARGRSLSEEQRARLAELRDALKLEAAAAVPGRARREPIVRFDWLDLRDEVLRLPPSPPSARFSSRPFLRSSAGPLRPLFRWLAGDADGLARLAPAAARAAIERHYAAIVEHYEDARVPLTSEQRERLAKHRDALAAAIEKTLGEPPIAPRLENHRRMRARVAAATDREIAFGRERLDADRQKLDATADELVSLVDEPLAELQAQAQSMATLEQLSASPLPEPSRPGAWIDAIVSWGLTIIGLLLILGLGTPFAAAAAALQLATFYLASPPWPGLPASGIGGHYLYVDRNLVELIAVLAVAGSGRWLGLDAVAGKLWRRARAARHAPAEVELTEARTGPNGSGTIPFEPLAGPRAAVERPAVGDEPAPADKPTGVEP